MPLFEMDYYSNALGMNTTVKIILPDCQNDPDKSFKTLYLLHGLKGDCTSWIRSSSIERYANAHEIAVVMPSVARSWYADTAYGAKYFTFVSEELPAVCRGYFKGMSAAREDNFVGGLSMGGYGALKVALTFPEKYYGCISLSGALDITRKGRTYSLDEWRGNFGFDIESAIQLEGGENDIFELLRNRAEEGKTLPKIFMWCGTEDSLINVNREYHKLLSELGVEHIYTESEGNHTWKWWDMHIQPALKYFFSKDGDASYIN